MFVGKKNKVIVKTPHMKTSTSSYRSNNNTRNTQEHHHTSSTHRPLSPPYSRPPTPTLLLRSTLLYLDDYGFGRIRAEEIRVLKKATLLRAVNEALFFVQPAVQSCFVFSTYHLLGNTLTAPKVFLLQTHTHINFRILILSNFKHQAPLKHDYRIRSPGSKATISYLR